MNAVIWYHEPRNELYHAGNGLIPELSAVEGARDSARAVFTVLFGFDPSPTEPRSSVHGARLAEISPPDPAKVLLMLFSSLEVTLRRRVPHAAGRGISAMWQG